LNNQHCKRLFIRK